MTGIQEKKDINVTSVFDEYFHLIMTLFLTH